MFDIATFVHYKYFACVLQVEYFQRKVGMWYFCGCFGVTCNVGGTVRKNSVSGLKTDTQKLAEEADSRKSGGINEK
jgi:hypothetical protein